MKKRFSLALCATMLVSMSACSSGSGGDEPTTLTVSTFALSEDIVQRDIIKVFEEQNNCKVVTDLGNAGDRFTKLKNNPAGIDVIEFNQSTAAQAYGENLVDKLTSTNVANIANLITPAKSMQEASGYGPAYTIQSVGIIYDKEKVGFEITSWDDLWRAELAGKIAIPDITTTFGPAMVHIASDYKKVDIKSDNGKAAFTALEELKPNVLKTYTKSSDLANMFAAGEISAAVVGDFAVLNIKKASEGVEYVVPASGTYANFNTIDVVSTSKNKELAYKYINFRISEELQNVTASSLNEGPTNANVKVSDDIAGGMTYGEVADNAKVIDYSFVNPLLTEWTDQWGRILNR